MQPSGTFDVNESILFSIKMSSFKSV
ncbi:hypothetical protein EMIT093MI4_140085 [Pseudomonas sp. IT-93MI4]